MRVTKTKKIKPSIVTSIHTQHNTTTKVPTITIFLFLVSSLPVQPVFQFITITYISTTCHQPTQPPLIFVPIYIPILLTLHLILQSLLPHKKFYTHSLFFLHFLSQILTNQTQTFPQFLSKFPISLIQE